MMMVAGAAPNSNGSGRNGSGAEEEGGGGGMQEDDLASTSSDSPNNNISRRDSTPLLASTRPPASTVIVERVSGTHDPTLHATEDEGSYTTTGGASSVRYRKKSAEDIRKDAQKGKEYGVPKPHKDGSVNWCHRATVFGQLVLRYCRMNEQSRGPKSCNDWVSTFLPCWRWLQLYQWRTTLWKDVVAGLTVGIMVIPQGMVRANQVMSWRTDGMAAYLFGSARIPVPTIRV
jgi:hypothetical protein